MTEVMWEVLGSTEWFDLGKYEDCVEIVNMIVQDEEAGIELLRRLRTMQIGESFLINEHDPEYIERWTRTR